MRSGVLMAFVIVLCGMVVSGCQAVGLAGDRAPEALPLQGVRVAILTGEGFHSTEAMMPLAMLANRGAGVTVVGPATGRITAYNEDVDLLVHRAAADVSADDFDALVLPGGTAPGDIRQNDDVVALAQAIYEAGKPVAAICHGPLVLVSAGVVEGCTMTGISGVADELREAGATYQDEAVVRDGNLVTSRLPNDIPDWLAAFEALLTE